MADRYLTWYIENPDENKSRQGETYILDKSYVPMAVRIYADKAPDKEDMEIDIKDDGTTIFGTMDSNTPGNLADITFSAFDGKGRYAALSKGANVEDWWEDFNDNPDMEIHSEVSLNFVKSGGAKGVTVVLELSREYETVDEER